jgi:streptogramin lyase
LLAQIFDRGFQMNLEKSGKTELTGFVNCPPGVGGSVGRISPFGSDVQASVTEVVPKVSTCTDDLCDSPLYITLGPDGNLWFAANFSIYRLTVPGHHLSQFPVPGQHTPPFPYKPFYLAFGITTGSDGNLWFTGGYGNAGNHVGRVSPRDPNNMTLYPVSATDQWEPRSLGHHHWAGRQPVLCHGV